MTDLIVPLLLLAVSLFSLGRKQDLYSDLLQGAHSGLQTLLGIAPSLIVLLSAVCMLRASGFLEIIRTLFSPVCIFLHFPAELLPLVLVRPISASAALALGADLIAQYGADSQLGRMAAVLLGCSETTFYAISVYFGAAGIRKTRWTLPAAIVADLVGYGMAVVSVRLFFP